MAVYNIVKQGDPVLREKARPVPEITPNVEKLVVNMIETMKAADGAGLAAPQVGVSKRIFVVDIGEGVHIFINPEISECAGNEKEIEGCLSVPGYSGYVDRYTSLKIKAQNLEGEWFETEAEGFFARALQHENDHLNGVLYIDKASEVFKEDSF